MERPGGEGETMATGDRAAVKQAFGVIGLDVMGSNLALNVERNGFSLGVYNRTWAKTEELLRGPGAGRNLRAARTQAEHAAMQESPRRVLLMVKAGAPVDSVLAELLPHLEPGDIVIDGGNSLFTDTERRQRELEPTGIRLLGMGVSGGEEGALWGPSLMPGGDREAYRLLAPILVRIAAKPEDDEPCVTWVGERGAGHFVKMVHNGIEYGDMQLIAETYDLLRHVGGLDNQAIREVFEDYNGGELQSFLIEITARILDVPDPGGSGRDLVDIILDQADQKGTGKWTVQTALDLGVAVPTIAAAVDARMLSARKDERVAASRQLPGPAAIKLAGDPSAFITDLRHALYCSKICSYAQGMALIAAANQQYVYGVRLDEMARIWKAGCIIRAKLLDEIKKTFLEEPHLANLLLAARFRAYLVLHQDAWRRTLQSAAQSGIATPAMSASLAYYDTYRRENLPANLIQAQRDFFGAHTYHRVDRTGTFHTDWAAQQETERDAATHVPLKKAS
jgi:6-phosphogluconate dehydrogenase